MKFFKKLVYKIGKLDFYAQTIFARYTNALNNGATNKISLHSLKRNPSNY